MKKVSKKQCGYIIKYDSTIDNNLSNYTIETPIKCQKMIKNGHDYCFQHDYYNMDIQKIDNSLSYETIKYIYQKMELEIDDFMRICYELIEYNKIKTITSREIQFCTRIKFPDKLKLLVSAGTKAVTRFNLSYRYDDDNDDIDKKKKPSMTLSFRSVLKIKVSTIKNLMKRYCYKTIVPYECRFGQGAPIYLAAVIECLIKNEIDEINNNYKKTLMEERLNSQSYFGENYLPYDLFNTIINFFNLN